MDSSDMQSAGVDDDLKPHVQKRSPGAIFRLEVLGMSTGPSNASANCGNV
jgi:hypothetical protein